MMKRRARYFTYFPVLFLFFAASAAAQGFRFDSQIIQQATIAGVTNAVVIPAAAQVAFCNFPANATPCTNKATTYSSQTLVTPCSTSTQIVLTGTTSCVASPDAQENWGVWLPAGIYSYTITLPGGVNLGPYSVTLFPPNATYALTFSTLTSASANPAASGSIRLATSDFIAWRNFANLGDVSLNKTGAANGNIPADTFITNGGAVGFAGTFFSSGTTTQAVTGLYRLTSNEAIAWRNNANSNDLRLITTGAGTGTTPADALTTGSGVAGIQALTFISNSGNNNSATGVLRLGNTEGIGWRNNVGNSDVVFSKSGPASGNIPADTFVSSGGSGGIWMSFFSGASTLASTTGVLRGASTDSLACWRNNGNSADLCLSKNASDELVWNTTTGGAFRPGSTTFANLGTPANGILVYCSDCTIANPCAGAGTGAIAKRLNGVWVCN